MKLIMHYVSKVWVIFFLSILCVCAEAVADLLQPSLLSDIVDVGIANGDMGYVLRTAAIMIAIVAMTGFTAIGRSTFSSMGSERIGFLLRADLYRKIQTLAPEELDRFGTATLMTRMTNDVTQIQNLSHAMMRVFIRAPILCIGSVIYAFRINARLAIIPLCLIPVIFFVIYLNLRIGFPLYARVQAALDHVNTVMREYLSGIRVVKAFNRFKYEVARFAVPNENLRRTSVFAARVISIFNPTVTFLIYFGIILIFRRGGVLVNQGELQSGKIIAFYSYMTQMLMSLNMISNILNRIVRVRASVARINEVLASDKLQLDPEDPEPLDLAQGIRFENVSFSYRGKKPALKDVSFSCGVGEKVGIIGSTGSGKTTLISLILQFYQPTQGRVTIFGADATKCSPAQVRENLAVVSQRITLFTGTILENIRWGNENAEMAEIEAVTRAAQAHGFIESFPDGYDTMLGHSGVNLSGGQRQRIAIARALVKKPKILILDDCLSAVDALTEASIRDALKEEAHERGLLIISQKISSILDCDRIVVLDDGVCDGVGTHEELLKSSQVYRDIYASQYGREALVQAAKERSAQ